MNSAVKKPVDRTAWLTLLLQAHALLPAHAPFDCALTDGGKCDCPEGAWHERYAAAITGLQAEAHVYTIASEEHYWPYASKQGKTVTAYRAECACGWYDKNWRDSRKEAIGWAQIHRDQPEAIR